MSAPAIAPEAALLAAARAGDERAFAQLTAPYRRELQLHCYRMLASLQDAEDLLQETLLRAWRRLDTFAGRSSFRRWLYTIATNACLNAIERRPKVLLFPSGEAAELPAVARVEHLQPYPDSLLPETDPELRLDVRESVALAFLAAIQLLPARQRAILVLRDVLGWSAAEAAELLETSVAAVNSGLQRARAALERERVRAVDAPSDEDERALLERFVDAWERVDIAGLVELLREDAVLAMPPQPGFFRGRDTIGHFFATEPAAGDLSRIGLLRVRANRRPAFACYLDGEPYGIMVFSIEDGAIAEIVGFPDATLFPLFGAPASLQANQPPPS